MANEFRGQNSQKFQILGREKAFQAKFSLGLLRGWSDMQKVTIKDGGRPLCWKKELLTRFDSHVGLVLPKSATVPSQIEFIIKFKIATVRHIGNKTIDVAQPPLQISSQKLVHWYIWSSWFLTASASFTKSKMADGGKLRTYTYASVYEIWTRKPSCCWQTRATRKHAKNCSNSTCLQRCCWQYWSIFIPLAVVASEICEIPRNSLKIQTYRVQGHPRSSILVPIESPYVTSL